MSKEYRLHYGNKVSTEVDDFVRQCQHKLDNKDFPIAVNTFIHKRMRHYGLNNKYLPKDFKGDKNECLKPV